MKLASLSAISRVAAAVAIVIIIAVAGGASIFILTSPTGPLPTSSSTTAFSSSSSVSSATSSSFQVSSVTSSTGSASAGLTKVTLFLDFTPPVALYTPFYYGIDQGIFARNGIDVSIVTGSGGTSAVAALSQGKADFAFTDVPSLIVSAVNANISNVKMVSAFIQYTNFAVLYNTATVHSVADLNGKRVGTFQGSGSFKVFQVFAKLNNINVSALKITYAQTATYASLVAVGQVDFITTTVDRLADIGAIAQKNNITLGAFPLANYGMDIYGHSILAATGTINSKPDLVKRFVQASLQSLVAAAQHPEDAARSFVKVNPQSNYDYIAQGFKLTMKTCVPNINSTSNVMTVGWVDQQSMQKAENLIALGYGFPSTPTPTSLYTNEFVTQPQTTFTSK